MPIDAQRHQEYRRRFDPAAGVLLAVCGALSAVAVAMAAERWLGLADVSLVFMLAVLVVASKTRTGPAVLTAVLCFLAYNFFFIEPRYTFYIDAQHGVATVLLFLAAALIAGGLASRLAMQVDALRSAHRHALARQTLAQHLAVAVDEGEILHAAEAAFHRSLDTDIWFRPDAPDANTAHGVRSESAQQHGWWFLPLRAPEGPLGAIGLKLPAYVDGLDEAQRDLARAMADDLAQALQRVRLAQALEASRFAHERDRLRAALLSSVSHDLRTPLAAILGAAGSLDSYGDRMNAEDRRALLDTVKLEGERLDRYIQNLLDMTRLGHGALSPERDWIGVDELIGAATGRVRRYRADSRFVVAIDPDVGSIRVNPALFEQALFNLIDNAAKFSPAGEAVTVQARRDADAALVLDVRDCGPGIPEDERERVFDMFYSVERGDRGRHGTGLGLAIARGIVEAHGGRVEALPVGKDARGAHLRIALPAHADIEGST